MVATEKPDNLPTKKLTHIVSGQKITKAIGQINAGFDATNKLVDRHRPAYQVPPIPSGGGGSVFELLMIYDAPLQATIDTADLLLCRRMGEEGLMVGDNIPVLRSRLCRTSPFRNKTRGGVSYAYSTSILRTATKGGDSIAEVITPTYEYSKPNDLLGGDVIRVMYVPGGVEKVNTQVGLFTYFDEVVQWLDCNDDARAWAKRAT